MSVDRADRLSQKLFEHTAPSEYEKRNNIQGLIRQLSDQPIYLDRLERMDPTDLMNFIEELYRSLPLKSIHELKDILNGNHEGFIWRPNSRNFAPINGVTESISEVRETLNKNPSKIIVKLCYIQLITALEAYLGDTLKSLVLQNDSRISNLIQRDSELSREKISLHKAFVNPGYPKKRVREYLSGLLYHNLEKVIKIYSIALGADIRYPCEDCGHSLLKAVELRHDLIHRNGFTVAGEKIAISIDDIEALALHVDSWVSHIEDQLNV